MAETWPIHAASCSLSTQISACAATPFFVLLLAGPDRARSTLAETASAGPLEFVTHTAARCRCSDYCLYGPVDSHVWMRTVTPPSWLHIYSFNLGFLGGRLRASEEVPIKF